MRLLLDTHIFLWWQTDDPRLSDAARDAISNPDNELLVSAVSAWEIVIKHATGRLSLPDPVKEYIADRIARTRGVALPVQLAHVLAAADLPLHHKDPFDRLLIAQAKVEGVPIVSDDPWFRVYGVERVG